NAGGSPAPGTVSVRSSPSGALIEIDGEQRRETTPTVISGLRLGTHRVIVSADGHQPSTHRIELTEDAPAATLDVTLESAVAPASGVLRVRTTPSGARVSIDGVETGTITPSVLPALTPHAPHLLRLELDGYEAADARVTLTPAEDREVHQALVPIPLGPDEARLVLDVH